MQNVICAGTSMKGTVKICNTPKTGNIVSKTTNLICTTIGTHRWRRIMIGGTLYPQRIAYVKSVLTFLTRRVKSNGNKRSESRD